MIAALAADGGILPATEFLPDQIQPASLDLRLGDIAYRVRASFLPGSTTVAQRIDGLKLHEFALTDGAVLETGCVYIVPLLESLALPDDIAAAANPKSSTGRLDMFTRVIADEMRGFDHIEPGYHGPLYAEISPRTFPVLVREGSRLSQIRFRRGHALLDGDALRELHARERLVDADNADVSEGVAVGVDLSGLGPGGLVGYRAKRHTGLIDVERRAGYSVLDFWEPMQARPDKSLILDPNEFYILASKEAVQVPPDYAAEMVPFDPLVGEFRVHYAGFFDPGFGYAGAGIAKAGIEEAGIVHAEFADQRIERHHLGGVVGWHLHGFLRRQDVEFVGVEDQALVGARLHRLPEIEHRIAGAPLHVDQPGMPLSAIADQAARPLSLIHI